MGRRVVGLMCVGVLAAWTARPVAIRAQVPIPCDPIVQQECMTNYTCQTLEGFTFCEGQPVQDGTSCTNGTSGECMSGPFTCQQGVCRGTAATDGTQCTHDVTGGCMGNATCHQGICQGTTPVQDGTTCSFVGNKCAAGHCMMLVPGFPLSTCTGITQKTCTPPSDPCKQAICYPTDGSCLETDKCNTFSGCETCNAGTCQPVNTGQPCANAGGDFNSCTTNDACVVEQGRGLCMGVPISGMLPTSTPTNSPALMSSPTPTPIKTPTATPTVTPPVSKPCAGDCNGDHQVTVDEEITMSGIVLGDEPASECPVDHALTIDDIVAGEHNALNGCPS